MATQMDTHAAGELPYKPQAIRQGGKVLAGEVLGAERFEVRMEVLLGGDRSYWVYDNLATTSPGAFIISSPNLILTTERCRVLNQISNQSDLNKQLDDFRHEQRLQSQPKNLTEASKPQAPPTRTKDAGDILGEAAKTFKERQATYKSNYRMVGPIMAILFPEGVPPALLGSDQFHLFELVVVKLSRLAISDLTHLDSARDAAVYCAMIEAIAAEQQAHGVKQ